MKMKYTRYSLTCAHNIVVVANVDNDAFVRNEYDYMLNILNAHTCVECAHDDKTMMIDYDDDYVRDDAQRYNLIDAHDTSHIACVVVFNETRT